MRCTGTGACQPFLRGFERAIDAAAGKLLHKSQQHPVQLLRSDAPGEPGEGICHYGGIKLLPIAFQEYMTRLVDQTHGVKRSCMHRTVWMLLHITDLIHPERKLTACRHICEDHVARVGKETSRELVAVSCASRNVKFHHCELDPNQHLTFIIALSKP